MENTMDRRAFAGLMSMGMGMGLAAAAGLGAAPALAEEPAAETADADGFIPTRVVDDPESIRAFGGTTLTLDELNVERHKRVDNLTDITCEDGTTVPALWYKLSTLVETYGFGLGEQESGYPAKYLMYLFDNDDEAAEHYLEMPWGAEFSVYEYADVSGRSVEECTAICDDLYSRGLLFRAERTGGVYYHHLAYAHGFFESAVKHMIDPDGMAAINATKGQTPNKVSEIQAGSPIYYAVPVDRSVVADERVLPLNDYETMLERYDVIAVVPCFCSLTMNMNRGVEVPPLNTPEMAEFRNSTEFDSKGSHLERCLAFGEEAEYFLNNGVGRALTKDEARAIIERSIDEGFVLQMSYARNTDVLCACHSECCGVLMNYRAQGEEVFSNSPIMKNASNYRLVYDRDACIQCGACVERCPMAAISMDDTDHPQVSLMCVRCGQCGLVCPAEARKLTAVPAEERLPIPESEMASHNQKFGYRVEHGLI